MLYNIEEKYVFLFALIQTTAHAITIEDIGRVNQNPGTTFMNTSGSNSLPGYPTLCPYNRFCQSPPLKVSTDDNVVSCCEKCSCDAKCYEVGNCCPDMPNSPARSVKYPCTKTATGRSFDLRYHVVNDCKNATIAALHPQCFDPAELDDLVLVSSPENGRVYKNKHCAICNDVTNYVIWNLNLDCQDILQKSFLSKDDANAFIFQNRYNCSISSLPPKSDIGSLVRCFDDTYVISRCNATWDWDFYDKDMEKACHDTRADQNVIYIDANHVLRAYANVYCYICNSPKNQHRKDLCRASDFNIGSKNIMPTFSAILDLKWSDNDVSKLRTKCQRNEVWDPFKEICRLVACPGGTVSNYGQCKTILKYSENYGVHIVFNVTTENHTNITYIPRLSLLTRSILTRLGSGCREDASYLYADLNSSAIYLSLEVSSSKLCSLESIMGALNKMAIQGHTQLRYKYKNRETIDVILRLLLQDDFKFDILRLEMLAYMSVVTHFDAARRMIDSSIYNYCPSMNITMSEFISLRLSSVYGINTLGHQSTDEEVNNNTEIVSVCVESYFQSREISSASLAVNSCSTLVIYSSWYFISALWYTYLLF